MSLVSRIKMRICDFIGCHREYNKLFKELKKDFKELETLVYKIKDEKKLKCQKKKQ